MSLLLSLSDAVRDVMFVVVGDVTSPQSMTSSAVTSSTCVFAGDELKCTALGNPTPSLYNVTTGDSALDVLILVNGSVRGERDGGGGHVRLSPSLIGRNLTIHCTAVNVVDSVSFYDNVSVTFAVLGQQSLARRLSLGCVYIGIDVDISPI